MALSPDLIIPDEIIKRQIAYAEEMKAHWTRHLANLWLTGNGRMSINGVWETTEEAAARIQELIDIHGRTVELISSFRVVEQPG